MTMKEKISISVDEDLLDQVHDELDYGDNRSEWVEDAIRLKLEAEASEGNPKAATAHS